MLAIDFLIIALFIYDINTKCVYLNAAPYFVSCKSNLNLRTQRIVDTHTNAVQVFQKSH